MKGQYLTIEYVMFFAIGIVMVMGVYMLFMNIHTSVREDSIVSQLDKTNELVRDSIVKIYESGSTTNSIITYNLSIPVRLSGHVYGIKIINNNINLNATEDYKIGSVLNLYNINIRAPNIIYSTKGNIQIKYQNDQVELS